MAVNIQPLFSDYVPTHHIISRQLLDLGLLWKAEFLWEKNNYNAKYTAWGSWKSPSMPYIKYTWEFIEVFDKETHKKTGRREDIDITADEFKSWVLGRWSFPPEIRMKDFDHPAMFPEELPRRLMKLFSYRNDIVLDPFNGPGTTTLVAYKNQRRFIGIDVSRQYCETAMKRLEGSQADFGESRRVSLSRLSWFTTNKNRSRRSVCLHVFENTCAVEFVEEDVIVNIRKLLVREYKPIGNCARPALYSEMRELCAGTNALYP